MREQSMHYNMKKIFCTTALALILGLYSADTVRAQGVISLGEAPKQAAANDDIPDEISLFGDETEVSVSSSDTPLKNTDGSGPISIGSPQGLPNSGEGLANEKPSTQLIPSIPSASAPAKRFEAPQEEIQVRSINQLGGQVIEEIDDDVFQQMSDLEKQTAVLTLELRREKVKNDIEALKAIQNKAREEEEARKGAEKLKIIAAEKEQERKVLIEQQKLKNLEIVYEKARQEKLLKAYKNKMLEQNQKWIEQNADTYKEIEELRKERQKIVNDFKGKFIQLTKLADQATNEVIKVRDSYAKTISDLQTQISILRARLEATERTNPFAESGSGAAASAPVEEEIAKLSDLYAVMEIRGKGSNLVAKLINDSGTPFMVKIGTTLQTGHVIDEITETYVRADKEGTKDYLYFSAGGILDREPSQSEELKVRVSDPIAEAPAPTKNIISSQGIPGVASEMTIR